MKKLLFIVNPRAGKTKSRAPLFDAVAQFSKAGYLVRVFVTEAGGQARDIAAQWGGEYDEVVCAGGDGTLNETLSGLMELEERPVLGYLPCGSTNDFAASLRLRTQLACRTRWTSGGTTTATSPMWRPSGRSPGRPTPPRRRRRTRWGTLRTF